MSKPTPKSENPEFQDFRDLAKNLLAVPKKEVDEKKAEYERKKSKKEKPAK